MEQDSPFLFRRRRGSTQVLAQIDAHLHSWALFIVSRHRATLGNSSSDWPSGLAINTQGHDAMSAIE